MSDDAELPDGADFPMRQAVRAACEEMTGQLPTDIFSGWGGSLDKIESELVRALTRQATTCDQNTQAQADPKQTTLNKDDVIQGSVGEGRELKAHTWGCSWYVNGKCDCAEQGQK